MRYCRKCGKELPPTAKFCGYCGEQVQKEKSTHKKHPVMSVAAGLLLLFAVVCLISLRIGKQNKNVKLAGQVSNVPETANQSDMTISAGIANAATENKTEYPQASPAMICIYDDDALWAVIRFSYDGNRLMTEYSEEHFTDGETEWTQQASMTYDNQERLIRQDITRSDMTFDDGSSGHHIYRYDSAGNLIYKESETFEGWSKTTCSYDSKNRLIRSREECEPYTVTTAYIYDSNGNVERREESYDDGYGSTWSETLSGDGKEKICTDYKPFELTFYKDALNTTRISITDKVGQTVWTTLLGRPMLRTNEHGYLTEIRDEIFGGKIRTYQIRYDGETPSEPSDEPVKAQGKLRYPISVNDCFVIYRNYFGRDMRNGNTIEICRSVEDGKEVLYFYIKEYFLEGEAPITYEVFKVFTDSGMCTGGGEGHSDNWPIFQAEEYYY